MCGTEAMAEASRRQIEAAAASARSSSVDALPPATVASTESSVAVSAADDSGAGESDVDRETGGSSMPAAVAPVPGPMMPPGMMPPHMMPGI